MRIEVHLHADIPMLEGVSRKQIEQAISPLPDYLDAARSLAVRLHGDLEGYLIEAVGLDVGVVTRVTLAEIV